MSYPHVFQTTPSAMNFPAQEGPCQMMTTLPVAYPLLQPGVGLMLTPCMEFPFATSLLVTPPAPDPTTEEVSHLLSCVTRTNPPMFATQQDVQNQGRLERGTVTGIPPTNFVRVPQRVYNERGNSDLDQTITFNVKGFPEMGVQAKRVFDITIENAGDQVLLKTGLRRINLMIIWPGYQPVEKHIFTDHGKITRERLLRVIASKFMEFKDCILKDNTPASDGNEGWEIVPDQETMHGIRCPEVFITRLVHRGAATWQPEFWAPKFRPV